jgi:hypothetical protein
MKSKRLSLISFLDCLGDFRLNVPHERPAMISKDTSLMQHISQSKKMLDMSVQM